MKQYLLFIIILILTTLTLGKLYYPAEIYALTGSHSNQSISSLALQDQNEQDDNWNNYIEFNSSLVQYTGIFTFKYEPENINLQYNFFDANTNNIIEWTHK